MDGTQAIKIAMVKAGDISGAELARRIGMAPQNLSRKMQAGRWTLDDLDRIASALGCSLVLDFVPAPEQQAAEQPQNRTAEQQNSRTA